MPARQATQPTTQTPALRRGGGGGRGGDRHQAAAATTTTTTDDSDPLSQRRPGHKDTTGTGTRRRRRRPRSSRCSLFRCAPLRCRCVPPPTRGIATTSSMILRSFGAFSPSTRRTACVRVCVCVLCVVELAAYVKNDRVPLCMPRRRGQVIRKGGRCTPRRTHLMLYTYI